MDLVRKLVANSTVRKAFVALVLAVLAALGVQLGAGCGSAAMPPAVAKAHAVLECQLAVLESVVPGYVAEDLVMAARAGNGAYVVRQLLGLGLTPEQVRDAAEAFGACGEPAPVPAIPTTERS